MVNSLIEDGPDGVNDGPSPDGGGGPNVPEFSVSEISGAVKRMIEGEFGHVRVRGEIGRVSRPRSGHVYLDLKDDRAVLSGVVWKGQAGRLEIQPEEGDEVIAIGRLTTFPGQSKYQIVIENLTYAGEGALLAKRERLRVALEAEGLFAPDRKHPLPYLPAVIGVVTSPSGAVIRDILHRLEDRFPVHVLVWPVAVQGAACAPEVAAAIRGFGALAPGGPVPRPDVLIVARGGGSVEDLWGFNEEIVLRAAAASPIPLISAVGHETDTTLIDFAADRRAPTPSAAAEMAVPVRSDLLAGLATLGARSGTAMARAVALRRQRVQDLARALPRPAEIVANRQQRLDAVAARLRSPAEIIARRRDRLAGLVARLPRPRELTARQRERLGLLAPRLPQGLRDRIGHARLRLGPPAARLVPRLIEARRQAGAERLADRAARLGPAIGRQMRSHADRVAALSRVLGTLGYRETLARGYALVRDGAGEVLTSARAAAAGKLEIEFADGRVDAEATGKAGGEAPRATAAPPATPSMSPHDPKPKPAAKAKKDAGQGSLF